MSEKAIVVASNVSKVYKSGVGEVRAVDNLSFEVNEGEFVVILGPSGAGKTTLLNLMGGMDGVTSGELVIDGENLTGMSARELTRYRRTKVGFVFQFYNLMPNLTAIENIELAVELCPDAKRPEDVMERVGLRERMNNFPAQLSGGEQQRVSIARAVAKNPRLLLCDEPTGALDSETGVLVLKLLLKMARDYKKTIIIVTHNQNIAKMADVVVRVKNGKIKFFEEQEHPFSADEVDW